MKKAGVLGGLLLVGIILALTWCVYLSQSPVWWSSTILNAINGKNPDLKVREVVIDKVRTDIFRGVINFQHVAVKFKYKDVSYFVSTGDVSVANLFALLQQQAQLPLKAEHVAIVSDLINVSDLQLEGHAAFKARVFEMFEATMKIAQVDMEQYKFNHLQGVVTITPQKVAINKVVSIFYAGQVMVDMTTTVGDKEDNGTVSFNVAFKKISLASLSDSDPSIFGGMKGDMDGQMQLSLLGKNVSAFRLRLVVPKGGTMKKQYVLLPLQMVPSLEKTLLTKLQQASDNIDYDIAQVEGISRDGLKFNSKIKMFSKALNLDLNYTLDINLEDQIFSDVGKFLGALNALRTMLAQLR